MASSTCPIIKCFDNVYENYTFNKSFLYTKNLQMSLKWKF